MFNAHPYEGGLSCYKKRLIKPQMRIGVITDVHANLPALQAVLDAFKSEGVDQIIHLGDVIAIGPFPKECLDLMLSTDAVVFVMGNHDDWYAHGLPQPRPDWMKDGELAHQYWTHDQLGSAYQETVAAWPWIIQKEVEEIKLAFMHYALREIGNTFKPFIKNPTPADLDHLFDTTAAYVFYGHAHSASDLQGRTRFTNPGSLGCQKTAVAPHLILEITQGKLDIQKRTASYDDKGLYNAFEARDVPERAFIYKAFFGNRFPPA
jgi:putative phosphoesterase